jgi:hypothetical protein
MSSGVHVKYPPVILVQFQWNLNFPHRLSENTEIWNFMKIHPVRAELFHADRRADMKLVAAFRNFAKVPKKE